MQLAETHNMETLDEKYDVFTDLTRSVPGGNKHGEEKQLQAAIQRPSQSKAALWTGRIVSGLVGLFLVFDGVTKLMRVEPVLKAAAQLGFSVEQIVWIGIVLLVCTLIFAIPRTAILGAILLTGYLGGATAIQVHVRNPVFETLFPVIFGVLVWAGIFLRDQQVRELIPVRRHEQAR
jgi:DoxX-like family